MMMVVAVMVVITVVAVIICYFLCKPRISNLVLKGTDSKRFRLCRLDGLSWNYNHP